MDSASIGGSERTSAPMQVPRFEVALAYQDLPTGLHARQFLNHVLDHCQLDADFSLSLWKLEMFHVPEIYDEGVKAAGDAALVLLSLRGDIGLEISTEKWLKQWIERRSDESALAVLIDCDMQRLDSMGQTLFRLQELTQLSQVRLFVGFVPSIPPTAAASGRPELEHTETIHAVRNAPNPSPDAAREGGINE
jgi:hypothetical protein